MGVCAHNSRNRSTSQVLAVASSDANHARTRLISNDASCVATRVCVQMAEPFPSVQVWTNGIQASCASDPVALGSTCYFGYTSSLTPTVSSVSRNTITAGDVLVIHGAGEFRAGCVYYCFLVGAGVVFVCFCETTSCSMLYYDGFVWV